MYFIIIRYTASMQISVNPLNSVYNKVIIIGPVVLRYVTGYVSQHLAHIFYPCHFNHSPPKNANYKCFSI